MCRCGCAEMHDLEFWKTLTPLGKLNETEMALRDELHRNGKRPEEIRDAIKTRREVVNEPTASELQKEWEAGRGLLLPKEEPKGCLDGSDDEVEARAKRLIELNDELYEEVRALRDQVITLHEVLTNKPFPPEHAGTPTNAILQVLIDGGRKLLDDAEQITKDAQSYAQGSARNSLQLQKKLDTVVGLLAQALLVCTKNEAPSGRTEPPSP